MLFGNSRLSVILCRNFWKCRLRTFDTQCHSLFTYLVAVYTVITII